MERGEVQKVNVIAKYLVFKGNTWLFTYYDKETKENKTVKRHNDPNWFILLTTGYTIQWFDDKASCKVYSNEVKSLKDEDLIVRSMKDWELFRGKYSEIKEKANAQGYQLCYCLTFLDKGEVNRISFKGASFFNVSELMKKIDINKYKVKFVWCEDGTKGAVKYKMPVIEQGGPISAEENTEADEKLSILKYNRGLNKNTSSEAPATPVEEVKEETDEDLPF